MTPKYELYILRRLQRLLRWKKFKKRRNNLEPRPTFAPETSDKTMPNAFDTFLTDRGLRNTGVENSSMWAASGSSYRPCQTAERTLPAGEFVVDEHPTLGITFNLRQSSFDDLIKFPDSDSDYVLSNITQFWHSEKKFRDFGFIWKRGVLLFGPPGSGKTSTVQLLAQDVIVRGGCVFYVTHPQLTAVGLYMFRQIEPNRPAVVILEDIDAMIQKYGESDLLALLDGELQISNVVFVATTNYPDKLDQRIINRPSRFDIVKKIGLPNFESRKLYIQTKNPNLKDESQIKYWADKTDKLSIAHIKELIILVEVFGHPFDQALKQLQDMKHLVDTGEFNPAGYV